MTSETSLAVIANGTSAFWALQRDCHRLRRLVCLRVSSPQLSQLLSQIELGKQLHSALPAMKYLATLPSDILADTPVGEALRLQHGVIPVRRSDTSDHADSQNMVIGYAVEAGPEDMVLFVHDTAGKANVFVPGDVLPRIAFNELLLQVMKQYKQLESIHFNDFKRLTRDEASAQQLFTGARYFDVDLFVGETKVDLDSQSGRLMAGIESNQAAGERNTSLSRMVGGVLNALHSGGDEGTPAWGRAVAQMPLGYGPVLDGAGNFTTRAGGGKRWKLIAPDESEVEAVRQMLMLAAQGEPWAVCGAPLAEASVRARGTKMPPGSTFSTASATRLSAFVKRSLDDPDKRHLWLTGRYRDKVPVPVANDGKFEGYVVTPTHGSYGHVDVDVNFGLPTGGFVDSATIAAIEERLRRRTPKRPTSSTCSLFTHLPSFLAPVEGADSAVERRLTGVGLSYTLRQRPVAQGVGDDGRPRGWRAGEGDLVVTVNREILERSVADAVGKAVHDLEDHKLGIDISSVSMSDHEVAQMNEADRLDKSAKNAEQEAMLSDTLARQAANPENLDPPAMSRHMASASQFWQDAERFRRQAAAIREDVAQNRDCAPALVEAELGTVAAVAGALRGYAGQKVPTEVNRALMKVGLDTLRLRAGETNEATAEWSLRLELPLADGGTAHVPVSGVVRNERRADQGDKRRMVQDAMAEQFLRHGRTIEELMTTFGKDRPQVVTALRGFAQRNGVRGRGKRSAIVDIPAEMTEVRTLLWEHLTGVSGTSKRLSRLEPLIVAPFMDALPYPNSFVMHDTTLIRTVLRTLVDAGPAAMKDGVSLASLARAVGASKTEVSALATRFKKDGPLEPPRVLDRDCVNPDIVRLRLCPHTDCVAPPDSRWLAYYLPVPFTTAYAGLSCLACRRVPDPRHERAYLPDSFFDWWNANAETHRANLSTESVAHKTDPDDYRPSALIPRGGRLFNLNESASKLGITYDALYMWTKSDDPEKPVPQRVSSRGKGGMKYVLTLEELQRVERLQRLAELRALAERSDIPDAEMISIKELSQRTGVHQTHLRDRALAGDLGPFERRPGPHGGPPTIAFPRDGVLNEAAPSEGTPLLPKEWITRHHQDLVFIGEAAERTGRTVFVIRRACERGELAYFTTDGGTRQFDTEVLDKWVTETGQATMTTKQASEYTDLHGDVLRAAVRNGELPARLTAGGHRRYDSHQLDLFLEAREAARTT